MKQTIIAATAAALLASATFGVAATAGGAKSEAPRQRPSLDQIADNAAAYSDAGIAALKAGLRLTAEQEKLWPPVETALEALAKERIDARISRLKAWRERRQDDQADAERPEMLQWMRGRADRMVARGDAIKGFVDAADPLFASLNDAQKQRFDALLGMMQRNRFLAWQAASGRWDGDGRRGPPHGRPGRPGAPHGPQGDDEGEQRL